MFLHGYLSSKESFAYQLSFFANYFNILAFDLKGFGENANMEYPYSLNDYIEEVKQKLKEYNIVKPLVIAHSFGGRIAIKLASENADFFEKIVLTGSAGLKPKFSFKRALKKLCYKTLKPFVKKEGLKRFYSKDYNALSDIMKQSFIKIVNEHLDNKLNDIITPTLVVVGEQDKETPPYMAKRIAKGIKTSELLVIKGAGHFAFVDKPYIFNMEVKEFLLL
ncbi:MAG: alpha/beta hydrolase [Clostridia bacterium]|nr:alpha/beta hydrolase [Clostridia bacterium]